MMCPDCGHVLWYVGNPDGFSKRSPERRAYYCDRDRSSFIDHGDARIVAREL
jgi:hypothetical protein